MQQPKEGEEKAMEEMKVEELKRGQEIACGGEHGRQSVRYKVWSIAGRDNEQGLRFTVLLTEKRTVREQRKQNRKEGDDWGYTWFSETLSLGYGHSVSAGTKVKVDIWWPKWSAGYKRDEAEVSVAVMRSDMEWVDVLPSEVFSRECFHGAFWVDDGTGKARVYIKQVVEAALDEYVGYVLHEEESEKEGSES